MHIPDGYLSPSTCAALYAGAAPFWWVALRRARRLLNARMVPLISLVAAFSFVIMMFNIPLPGGTSGHAVGMAAAAILLGPWPAILAISVALLLQAVFFGDGGITAFGANSFNMAVVGSLAAYAVYRMVAGRTPLQSPRRVIAAALAGYVAINLAALCAAVEFGLQPGWFHDAGGAPLYAPYPLDITLPAMMIGHLSIAGMAELAISGGLVAWLQHSNVALLEMTAPGAVDAGVPPKAVRFAGGQASTPGDSSADRRDALSGETGGTPVFHADSAQPTGLAAPPQPLGWAALRPLWIGLATLMIAAPLGLLATGAAWGEWGVEDFRQPEGRQQITAASRGMPPPENPPAGLVRLGAIWSAPFPDYAPSFIRNRMLGYVLSAMFGTGCVILACLIGGRLARLRGNPSDRPIP